MYVWVACLLRARTPSFHGLGQDVEGEVAQQLELHWDSTCGGPFRVRCAALQVVANGYRQLVNLLRALASVPSWTLARC
jgi:hypothetical protein